MARTATKNVKLSTIKIAGTEDFYPQEFVELMAEAGHDEIIWPAIYKALALRDEVKSKQASDKKSKREARLKNRQDNVKEILAELGIDLPEGLTINSLEVKEKGPKVDVLDEAGKPTGEKEQDVTHYDIDLRWGSRGTSTLLRRSVSTGGKKAPKADDVIDAEIEAVKKGLVESLLKIHA